MDMVAAQQFFKFHPLSFFDDVINAVQDNFVDGADDLEKHLKKDHPKDGKAIGEGLTEFLKDMQKSVNANFDRFEVYGLRNVFQVPRGLDAAVQLPPLDEAPVDPLIELVMARRTLQESMQEAARADQELLARQEETAALERLVESLKAARRPSPQLAREVGEAAERLHTEVRRLQGHDSLVGGLQPRLDQDIELLGKDLTGAQ